MILLAGMCMILVAGSAAIVSAQGSMANVKEAMVMLKEKTSALGVAKIEEGSIFFGEIDMSGNFDIVDEVADSKICTATVFVKKGESFIRVATNVIKEGRRVIGTELDPAGAAYAAITKGEAYYGQVDILGKQYEAGYEPIKDASGNVIGVLYVGFKL